MLSFYGLQSELSHDRGNSVVRELPQQIPFWWWGEDVTPCYFQNTFTLFTKTTCAKSHLTTLSRSNVMVGGGGLLWDIYFVNLALRQTNTAANNKPLYVIIMR